MTPCVFLSSMTPIFCDPVCAEKGKENTRHPSEGRGTWGWISVGREGSDLRKQRNLKEKMPYSNTFRIEPAEIPDKPSR